MATQAQIDANRRNAKLSTGPRTDAGKAAIRQNALLHGCCSGLPLMRDEPETDFSGLQNILREENQPIGANEEILVYMMTVHVHNFGRANLAICDALEAAEVDQQSLPPLPLALRYQMAANRGFQQNLNQLRKVQKERRLEEIGFDSQKTVEVPADPPQAPPPPPAGPPKKEPVAAHQPVPAPIGVAPAVTHLVDTPEVVERAPASPSQAPPRAA
jgi:hypothetical protein